MYLLLLELFQPQWLAKEVGRLVLAMHRSGNSLPGGGGNLPDGKGPLSPVAGRGVAFAL
jgi:hypothetical protein